MKQKLFILAVVLLGGCCGPGVAVVAQSLPSSVEPGAQRDRFLDRDLLTRPRGPAVLREINCNEKEFGQEKSFTLRAVHLEHEMVDGESIDPAAYWTPYLNQGVTLEKVCTFARALADDYAREIGRKVSAILPAQYIDGGIVRIMIVPE